MTSISETFPRNQKDLDMDREEARMRIIHKKDPLTMKFNSIYDTSAIRFSRVQWFGDIPGRPGNFLVTQRSGDTYVFNPAADNPFAASSDPNVRKEIFVKGFRNPWEINTDPLNGDIWVTTAQASSGPPP